LADTSIDALLNVATPFTSGFGGTLPDKVPMAPSGLVLWLLIERLTDPVLIGTLWPLPSSASTCTWKGVPFCAASGTPDVYVPGDVSTRNARTHAPAATVTVGG